MTLLFPGTLGFLLIFYREYGIIKDIRTGRNMQEKVYDLIIAGAGPAGITAAIYAARKKLDFAVITRDIGGQTVWSGDVENYTGYQFVSGPELALKFQEHLDNFGIRVNMPESLVRLEKKGALLKIVTDRAEYLSRTLIAATGKKPRSLGVPGETEFKNKGVTYCATCDGPLFSGKDVAVIGGGNSGLDAVLGLANIAKKIYLLEKGPFLPADAVMVEKAEKLSNVEIITSADIKAVQGKVFVENILVEANGRPRTLPVKGVFVEIGLIPNTGFEHGLRLNDRQEIIVDCQTHTNIEGVFAAGDVTNVVEKQIIIACGEGAKASLAAAKFIFLSRE